MTQDTQLNRHTTILTVTHTQLAEGWTWDELKAPMYISLAELEILRVQKQASSRISDNVTIYAMRFDELTFPEELRKDFFPIWESMTGFKKLQKYSVSRDPDNNTIHIKITECKFVKTSEVLMNTAKIFEEKGD